MGEAPQTGHYDDVVKSDRSRERKAIGGMAGMEGGLGRHQASHGQWVCSGLACLAEVKGKDAEGTLPPSLFLVGERGLSGPGFLKEARDGTTRSEIRDQRSERRQKRERIRESD